jgi:antitoxin component YwqK of YwqJK toxin-antitoxin module
MIKFFAIVLFLFFGFFSQAQETQKKTYYKSGRLESITFTAKGFVTRIDLYYENGKRKKLTSFGKDGRLIGLQIDFFENGLTKKEVNIIGDDTIPLSFLVDSADANKSIDVITCVVKEFYPNGKIKSKGYIVNGMRSGYWVFYKESGEFESYKFYKCLLNE